MGLHSKPHITIEVVAMNKTYKLEDTMGCIYPVCDMCKECYYNDGDDDE